jgi:hypothetical protein
MKRYRAGQDVEAGFYLNTHTAEIVPVGPKGGRLDGPEGSRYLRIPALVMLFLAPVLGALYVVFLPLAGFAMLFRFGAGKAAEGARAVGHGLAALTMPGLRLGTAFFHRRRHPESKGEGPKAKG